jgi:serine/threonine-protein kinase
MSTALTDSLAGRLLDRRYRIESRLARGGMASVYAATDTRLDRRVAVKVMHPALADDEEFVARFIREARAAAALSHPNVVAVFDQGTDDGVVFLVMEYVHGHTLRDVLRSHGRLGVADALAVLEPVLAALSAAHDAGLVHRDVKPENVLISSDGRVKVADFGLARAVAGTSQTATTSGLLIGTVAYLAPEQVEHGTADARTDVYAAGVVLYELLTGSPPFPAETPLAVAYRHVHEDVPAPSRRVSGVPAQLDALVAAATERDPDERPADASELLDRLARVRGRVGRSGRVPMLTDTEPIRRPLHDTLTVPQQREPVRRRRRWSWLAAALATLLVAAAGAAGWWFGFGRYAGVPRLIDDRLATARSLAGQHGLRLQVLTPVFDNTVPAGRVAVQQPGPGGRLLHGGTLAVALSKGPTPVAVPAVSNTSAVNATARLESAGLRVDKRAAWVYNRSAPDGEVIGTDPPAGRMLRYGWHVRLVISKGPPPVALPSVRGEPVGRASALLHADHLNVTTITAYSDSVPAGQVISEQPRAGTKVPVGDSVRLVVSKGAQLFALPNVIGMPVGQAYRLLSQDGFQPQVVAIPGPGIVRDSDPLPGARIRHGSTVTLYVF